MGGNQYNEHWTLEESESFLKEAVEISKNAGFDFIGEVAREQNTYRDVYDYIVEKFPSLKHYKSIISRNCETNCFSDGKKGNIVPSLAIMNLKSNHGWTDRSENTVKGKLDTSRYTDEELEEKLKEYDK
jgi:hypothetical protein